MMRARFFTRLKPLQDDATFVEVLTHERDAPVAHLLQQIGLFADDAGP